MADHNATIGSATIKEKVVAAGRGPHVCRNYPLKAGQADLEAGLVVSLDQAGQVVPYDAAVTAAVGVGDAAETAFSATLGKLVPGSVSVTDGVETFADNGCGTLTGSAAGTGSVNYDTGLVSVSFHAAPADEAAIAASFKPAIKGVLNSKAPADAASAEVVVFGQINRTEILVGSSAPSGAVLAALDALNLWPIG